MKISESNEIEAKLKNLTYIVIIGFVVLALLIVGLYFTGGSTSGTTNNNTDTSSSSDSSSTAEYDVSKMNEVTGSKAAKLFDEKGTNFLFIGRSTCGVCVSLVPYLNEAMEQLDITINYLPLTSTFRTDFADLFDHLDIKTTINSNEGTYGSLLKEYGYTPIVVVIKDGKMVDGFVGSKTTDTIVELFKKYL